jgi:hypothetical protein
MANGDVGIDFNDPNQVMNLLAYPEMFGGISSYAYQQILKYIQRDPDRFQPYIDRLRASSRQWLQNNLRNLPMGPTFAPSPPSSYSYDPNNYLGRPIPTPSMSPSGFSMDSSYLDNASFEGAYPKFPYNSALGTSAVPAFSRNYPQYNDKNRNRDKNERPFTRSEIIERLRNPNKYYAEELNRALLQIGQDPELEAFVMQDPMLSKAYKAVHLGLSNNDIGLERARGERMKEFAREQSVPMINEALRGVADYHWDKLAREQGHAGRLEQQEGYAALKQHQAEQRADLARAEGIYARDEQVQAAGDIERAGQAGGQQAREQVGGAGGAAQAAMMGAQAAEAARAAETPAAIQRARDLRYEYEKIIPERRAAASDTGQAALLLREKMAREEAAYSDMLRRNREARNVQKGGHQAWQNERGGDMQFSPRYNIYNITQGDTRSQVQPTSHVSVPDEVQDQVPTIETPAEGIPPQQAQAAVPPTQEEIDEFARRWATPGGITSDIKARLMQKLQDGGATAQTLQVVNVWLEYVDRRGRYSSGTGRTQANDNLWDWKYTNPHGASNPTGAKDLFQDAMNNTLQPPDPNKPGTGTVSDRGVKDNLRPTIPSTSNIMKMLVGV